MTPQSQPSALAPTYTCKICRQTLTLQGPPIIGRPGERLARAAQMLTEHLGQAHKKEMAQIAMQSQNVTGWMFMDQFAHNDNELAIQQNSARLWFRHITKRVEMPDELIEKQANQFLGSLKTSDPQMFETMLAMLKTMRDALEEVPQNPTPTPRTV